MNAFRILPKKSLGQNFLRDPNYVRKIAVYLDIQAGDAVLEIGPGEGALTKALVGRGRSLAVVDIDPRVTAGMRTMFAGSNVEIINEDLAGIRGNWSVRTNCRRTCRSWPSRSEKPPRVSVRLIRYGGGSARLS